MVVKQNKAGKWQVVKKDGTLGKTKFSTQKAAQSQARGPTAKGKGKPKGKPKGKGKAVATTSSGSKAMGIGAAYQAGKFTIQAMSPVIDSLILHGPTPAALKAAQDKGLFSYMQGLGVAGADQWLSKRYRVANALSRGSVSAWLPEGFAILRATQASLGKDPATAARTFNVTYTQITSGYDPAAGKWNPRVNPDTATYHVTKWAGVSFRLARSKVKVVKAITEPIHKVARALGLSL